jgi:hypothetical protein
MNASNGRIQIILPTAAGMPATASSKSRDARKIVRKIQQ